LSSPETPFPSPHADDSLEEELRRILTEEVGAGAAPSAVAAVDVGGRVTGPVAVGTAVAFGDGGAALAPGDRVPAHAETVYDLASVTKIVSTVAALALVADGVLDLDEPVGRHLPTFRHGDRAAITLRHLLTHTSGLPGTWEGWRTLPAGTDRAGRLEDLLSIPWPPRRAPSSPTPASGSTPRWPSRRPPPGGNGRSSWRRRCSLRCGTSIPGRPR
jgi:CubicO group peptidase (beta-lactamase class C family)